MFYFLITSKDCPFRFGWKKSSKKSSTKSSTKENIGYRLTLGAVMSKSVIPVLVIKQGSDAGAYKSLGIYPDDDLRRYYDFDVTGLACREIDIKGKNVQALTIYVKDPLQNETS